MPTEVQTEVPRGLQGWKWVGLKRFPVALLVLNSQDQLWLGVAMKTMEL